MKFQKKLLAMIATVSLLATSVATTVFAVPNPTNSTITNDGKLVIEKVLKVTKGSIIPNERFSFSIQKSSIGKGTKIDNLDVKEGIDLKNADSITSKQFTNTDKFTNETEKTISDKTASYDFNDTKNVEFPKEFGIYRYTVTEKTGSNISSITYDRTKYLLDVYVDGTGKVVALVAKELEGEAPKDKKVPLKFNNKYETQELTISKKVDGISAEKTKDFDFTLKVEASSTLTTGTKIKAKKHKGTKITDVEITVGQENTFQLKHDESVVVTDLPYKTKYTIKESDSEGYTKKIDVKVTTKTTVENEYEINKGKNEVNFTNTNNTITPTGLILNVAPYAAGLILVVGLGVLLVVKRRKVTE